MAIKRNPPGKQAAATADYAPIPEDFKGKRLLVDGDILAFRAGLRAGKEEVTNPQAVVRNSIDTLLRHLDWNLEPSEILIGISPGSRQQFRYVVLPDYKANRGDKPKPEWLPYARDYLQEKHGAIMSHPKLEADDWMADQQDVEGLSTIICTIDKDLRMVPGRHYNLDKETCTVTSELEGERQFWYQMLIGDSADNILGLPGMGPKGADKLLDATAPSDWFDTVLALYRGAKALGGKTKKAQRWAEEDNPERRFYSNAAGLWMLRRSGTCPAYTRGITYSVQELRFKREEPSNG